MSKGTSNRRIGDIAFTIDPSGLITRTVVATVRVDGYDLLQVKGPHFFAYEEAREAAKEVVRNLLKSDEITRKQEVSFKAHLASLDTDAYREQVEDEPFLDKSNFFSLAGPKRTFPAEMQFTAEYLEPGTQVWAVITPAVHYSITESWRPRPYFILAGLVVEEVTFARYNPALPLYHFGKTRYSLRHENLATSEQAARERMTALFEEETCGTIHPEKVPLFSIEDEKEFRRQMHEQITSSIRRGGRSPMESIAD